MGYICLLDTLDSRRDAIVLALRPLLDDADSLDPDRFLTTRLSQVDADTIAVVGLGAHADDRELGVVRLLSDLGCDVLVYGHNWDRAPLGVRCRALLAGAGSVLDTSQPDFESTLAGRLALAIRRNRERRDEEQRLRETMGRLGIVGENPAMRALGRWLLKVGPLSDLPVLITGETGTGKELIARAIHQLDQRRRHGPFVPLNCATLGAGLAESELFGHRKGAFTGASHDRAGLVRAANGGMLLLDEIGELDVGLQAKLLRVLQENRVRGVGEDREEAVSVRVLAATNRDLGELVEQGRFRKDLFYRLSLLTTKAPALSERGNDIEILVDHFLHKHGGGRTLRAAPSLVSALKAMSLPGNVRQLENLIQHAVAHAREDSTIGIEELPASVWDQLSNGMARPASETADDDWTALLDTNAWNLAQSMMTCERHFLKAALTRARGNQSATARLLGITPRSIYNKLRKHRIAR